MQLEFGLCIGDMEDSHLVFVVGGFCDECADAIEKEHRIRLSY